MDLVYNYIFWYNTYENLWYAIPRNQYTNFFSGHLPYEGVVKSSKIDTLIFIVENPEQIS